MHKQLQAIDVKIWKFRSENSNHEHIWWLSLIRLFAITYRSNAVDSYSTVGPL